MDDGPSNSGMNNGTSAADEDPNLEPEVSRVWTISRTGGSNTIDSFQAMEDEPVIDPTENLSRPSISRSVTPLRITRRSLRKHIGCDDPMEDGPSTSGINNSDEVIYSSTIDAPLWLILFIVLILFSPCRHHNIRPRILLVHPHPAPSLHSGSQEEVRESWWLAEWQSQIAGCRSCYSSVVSEKEK